MSWYYLFFLWPIVGMLGMWMGMGYVVSVGEIITIVVAGTIGGPVALFCGLCEVVKTTDFWEKRIR